MSTQDMDLEGAVSVRRAALSRIGYMAADNQGNFAGRCGPASADDSKPNVYDFGLPCCGWEGIEPDPSERMPGGPIAEALVSAGLGPRRRVWLLPLAAFLGALLLQSAGLHGATHRYVYSMSRFGGRPEENNESLVTSDSTLYGTLLFQHAGLQDNLVAWFGRAVGDFAVSARPNSAGRLVLLLDMIAGLVPIIWLAVVLRTGNLRIWVHTLVVGAALALLMGFAAWMTLVPQPEGWDGCRKHLYPWALDYFQGEVQVFKSLPLIIWFWLKDLVLGMRNQQQLVCAGNLSGPSYLCALFSLSLYDASRAVASRLQPPSRRICHWVAALLLSFLVLVAAFMDLTARRQYTANVTLALVLVLLSYTSPEVAFMVDFVMVWGSSVKPRDKEGHDIGDVIIPPCCMPFCCLHGRYFLYTQPAKKVQELLRSEVRVQTAWEETRKQQEELVRRLLQLDVQLEYVRLRAEVRERHEAADADFQLNEQLRAAQHAHEQRLATLRMQLEAHEQHMAEERTRLEAAEPARRVEAEPPGRQRGEGTGRAHRGVPGLPGGERSYPAADRSRAPWYLLPSSCNNVHPCMEE